MVHRQKRRESQGVTKPDPTQGDGKVRSRFLVRRWWEAHKFNQGSHIPTSHTGNKAGSGCFGHDQAVFEEPATSELGESSTMSELISVIGGDANLTDPTLQLFVYLLTRMLARVHDDICWRRVCTEVARRVAISFVTHTCVQFVWDWQKNSSFSTELHAAQHAAMTLFGYHV
jgi:hypothetical protein